MDTLIASVLDSLMRRRKPALEALALLGEPRPEPAATALLDAASLPELAPTRSSWVPALLVSARPGRGAQLLHELTRRHLEVCGEPLRLAQMPGLALVLGSSELLGRLLLRNPGWVDELVGDPPPPPGRWVPDPDAEAPSWDGIRETNRRGLLRVVARELLGCPLQESLAEFSLLAEACLRAALDRCSVETEIAPPAILALGQLGGRELGISREIELLCLAGGGHEGALRARRLVEHLAGELGRADSEGALYELRTAGRGTKGRAGASHPPHGVYSLSEALELYGRGGPPDRCELLRLRHIAGPRELGRRFVCGIAPFVFGGGHDPAGGGRASGPRRKLDPESGEIAALEAFVHALQLEHGGEKRSLRTPNLLDALESLRVADLIDADTARLLTDSYGWLRRAEHFLQLVDERPAMGFPSSPEAQVALARCMGYREPEGTRARERLLDDWRALRSEVRHVCRS